MPKAQVLTKNGWNLRLVGSTEVYLINEVREGAIPRDVFVARFKYRSPRTRANAFVKFLVTNFTPDEYMQLYAGGMAPLLILRTKGFAD
jgi:hypothetical protein